MNHMELEGIVKLKDYGFIRFDLNKLLEDRGIAKNKLSILTGVSYNVVSRYCGSDRLGLVDLDFLAKVCCVLNCDITDLLSYVPGKSNA